MKRIAYSMFAATTLALGACGNAPSESAGNTDTAAAEVSDARLIAALSYADWCGSCKTLDPKLQEVRAGGDLGAAFVTLDYTAKDQDAFFASADAAGIGVPVRAQFAEGIKTGVLLLINVDDAKVVGVVKKEVTPAEIAAAVKDAAAGA